MARKKGGGGGEDITRGGEFVTARSQAAGVKLCVGRSRILVFFPPSLVAADTSADS